MAQYTVTSKIQTLIDSGMTEQEIKTAVPNLYKHSEGWDANGRKALDALDILIAKRAPKPVAPAVGDEPRATERQIAYALDLIEKNAEGSFTATATSLRKMSRREISRLIDSLQSEW